MQAVYVSTLIFALKMSMSFWTSFSYMKALKWSLEERTPLGITLQDYTKVEESILNYCN
jgi:hypothetical protein